MTTAHASAPALARARTYASFVRLEHTLFSLPLILAGIFSAPGPAMSIGRWALIALAAVSARTAAMSLNRLIDRRLDALNPRTRSRELPSGAMASHEAWTLLVVTSVTYVAACAALGSWFLRVAIVPLAVFVAYPYLKRFTALCHAGVGVALALSPLAGYAAAHPGLERPAAALWLSAFALAWVTGFDIIYATLDEAFDREHGVHSMVVSLGRTGALRVSALLHLLAFGCLAMCVLTVLGIAGSDAAPLLALPSALSFAALLVAGVLLMLEQRWAEDVNLAFFKVNVWVGGAVLAAVLAARIRI
jgi:4-hydroxybenzoate polyprenyltransferase